LAAIRIHSVLIVPDLGHCGAGRYDRGRSIGRFAELDAIDGYVEAFAEELDNDGVRVATLPTRSNPGVPLEHRAGRVEANQLVIHCCAGWGDFGDKTHTVKNITRVHYGSGGARELAEEISEAASEWGQCYVFGHRTANPDNRKADPLLSVKGALGIRIEPFLLDGPDADTYLAHLHRLGVALGRAVSSYLRIRGLAQARGAVGIKY
jgi:hypothetical protein